MKTPGTATHIVNTVFTDLEHTENYRVNSNKIAFCLNTGYDAYISNGKTSFTVRFEVINLSCNPKITQKNRLYWKFLQTCGRTRLSSPWLLWEDLWSRYFIRPCQRSHQYQSFSQSNPLIATWKRGMCIPGHHIRVSCVYFGFLFPFGYFLVFSEVNHRWPWRTPWPRPWPTPGFVPTRYILW